MFTARRLVHDAASEPGFWAMELLPRFVLNYDWTFNLFKDICTAPYFHACGTCSMQTTEATNTEADSTAQTKVNHSLHDVILLNIVLSMLYYDIYMLVSCASTQ